MNEAGFPSRLFDRIDELERLRHPDAGSLAVHAGSILAVADAAAAPFTVSHYAARHLDFAIDHLTAIRALIVKADMLPTYAAFTLLRAAVENLGSAMWLISGKDATERVLRALQTQYRDAMDFQKADALLEPHFPELTRSDGIGGRLDQVRAVAGRNNLSMVKVKKKDPWNQIVRSLGFDDKTADMAENLWKSCSACAHGDEWAYTLMDFEELPGSTAGIVRLKIAPPPAMLASMLSLTLTMAEHVLDLYDSLRLPSLGR
ncbi:hypothetical protein GCM10027290_30610 [Micromonospora sonneratiae]|uniref:AbiV family abortive infection protein n=1 Tax=Micromonospora sonneratiae TaxID=1184706 RepID=A0ABW3YAB4_9ACTN